MIVEDDAPLIQYFDMFAGIGGFRTGLTRAGGFQCVGHCEIDKYADRSYRAIHDIQDNERFYPDARSIDPAKMPNFQLLCGGFPCQAFSVCGERRSFNDPRGTLFFEIARIAKARKTPYLLMENVPGLLYCEKGRAFSVILSTLNDLGYGVEWMVLNAAAFGLPQVRKRLFIFAYRDLRCAGKLFPLAGTREKKLLQLIGGGQGYRVYDPNGAACTQTANGGGGGAKTGLYFIDLTAGHPKQTDMARCLTAQYGKATLSHHQGERSGVLMIREATKKGYAEALPGDGIKLGYENSDGKRGRVGHSVSHTLTATGRHGVVDRTGRIRKLMPRECLRLQGFDEEQIDKLLAITSDAQAYKQAGNAVAANVVEAIGRRIREIDEDLKQQDREETPLPSGQGERSGQEAAA